MYACVQLYLEVTLGELNFAGDVHQAAFAHNGHAITQHTRLALDLNAFVQELLLRNGIQRKHKYTKIKSIKKAIVA